MSAAPLRLIRGHASGLAQPGLRLVAAPPQLSRAALFLLVLAALGVFGIVGVGARTAEAAISVRALESDVAELKARYDELTAEVAELESPDRIRRLASGRLGMVEPDQPAYLVVDGRGHFQLQNPSEPGLVDGTVADPVKQALSTQP